MSSPDRLLTALSDRYRIERELGAGGMAIVYLAHDLRHDRKVAIKVLRPELAAVLGAERFLQEIRTTANLQHPHILPLFDSGEADSFLYYVMPFVDGETLRDKLNRETQLGIEEAVQIASEVADALDYAHNHDVIHRDIKPGNILLHNGRPMVADFGIALAISAAVGDRMTETGLSLGTPHYMSPEQATADKELTPRSDIYSLGAVLYEMLTGDPPHTGSSAQQIIMKIVTDEPRSVTDLRKSVPRHVALTTAKALQKLPADRFGGAGEFQRALTTGEGLAPFEKVEGRPLVAPRSSRNTAVTVLLLVAIAVLAVLAAMGWTRANSDGSVTRLTIHVPDGVMFLAGQRPSLAISPDGRAVSYVSNGLIHLHQLDRFESEPVAGAEGGQSPFFSTDGTWLGFAQQETIKRIAVDGGVLIPFLEGARANWGVSWGDDDLVVFVPALGSSGVWMVRDALGTPTQVSQVIDSALETAHVWPQVLPGGEAVLFTVLGPSGGDSDSRIVAQRLETGRRMTVVERATFGRYVSTGHVLYAQSNGAVLAVPFDVNTLRVTGATFGVLSDVKVAAFGGAAAFDVSNNGTLVYIPGTSTREHRTVIVDREGTVVRSVGEPVTAAHPAISPDGSTLAATVRVPANNDVMLVDLETGDREHFTFAPPEDESPVWSPDGQRLAYTSAWTGAARRIFIQPTDRAVDPVLLRTAPHHPHLSDWSPDGRWLAFYEFHPQDRQNIWVMRADSNDAPTPVATTHAAERDAYFSPDGQWLVYTTDESGRSEINTVSFPGLSGRRPISTGGGTDPRWRGGEVSYWNADTLMVVRAVSQDGVLDIQSPEILFTFPGVQYYDIGPNGDWFILIVENVDARAEEIRVVLNWFEELRALEAGQH